MSLIIIMFLSGIVIGIAINWSYDIIKTGKSLVKAKRILESSSTAHKNITKTLDNATAIYNRLKKMEEEDYLCKECKREKPVICHDCFCDVLPSAD